VTNGHGGNLRELARRAGRDPDAILDFSASVNPLGPPESLRALVSRNLEHVVHYPDPDAAELVELLARRYAIAAEQIVIGNGSSELLFALARGCRYARAVIPIPAYTDYAAAVEAANRPICYLPMAESNDFALDWNALAVPLRGAELVWLGQPNNPTGRLFDGDAFRAFAAAHPATNFMVDEAFAGFVPDYRSLIHSRPANVIVVQSLTKFYAIPGLRLGFAVADEDMAARIRRQIPRWSVNALAQAVAPTFLADESYARQTLDLVEHQRAQLATALLHLPGLHVYPSAANYLLVRLDRAELDALTLADRLLQQGIAIRTFGPGQHLDGRFFRVAIRTAEENAMLCSALREQLVGWVEPCEPHHLRSIPAGATGVLAVPGATGVSPVEMVGLAPLDPPYININGSAPRRRAKSLMIQGTSSNAGKSVLTAALCRILLQDGVRVAPFKAQNMSLNSFVARDGGEMGRAQVVQAQACRLDPDVRMNPVLLKPNSDTGCQVIVRGQPVGNMQVGEYVRYKPQAFVAVRECYNALAEEFDAVILEGAGSPGEVNLKAHDIVNMRMAQYARSPVLVVGDIDRGGVFASFVGTMEVLAPWERKLVAGWIVNRFRGDASLLDSAFDYTLRHTGRPVLGVVPYLPRLNLPQEDSVEFKSGALDQPSRNGAAVEIAVVDLPHISNFTDFDAFGSEPDVRLKIVRSAGELDHPDAVILPGSKNTLGDLAYLRHSGLAARIAELAREGKCEIVGICGGFQMLGREIADPLALESSAGALAGLGLLGVRTVMAAEKTLVRTTARHLASGLEVRGYEIHHGQTTLEGTDPLVVRADGQAVGAGASQQSVWGTYLHGLFDADPFRRWFLDRLRVRRGLAPLGEIVGRYDLEPALDRLAEVVRRSLPIDKIYALMGLP
jgi:cobyric acid synthase CobQ/L-threonine-O-3-phosphate decarboxylase